MPVEVAKWYNTYKLIIVINVAIQPAATWYHKELVEKKDFLNHASIGSKVVEHLSADNKYEGLILVGNSYREKVTFKPCQLWQHRGRILAL
jgi:hypothetical protein